jgi:phospholipase/lecithinase/hemolysin
LHIRIHGQKQLMVNVFAVCVRVAGFTQTGLGCCGTGLVEMGELCTNTMVQCQSPQHFMFFDSVHPTQTTYKALADQIVQSHMHKFVK